MSAAVRKDERGGLKVRIVPLDYDHLEGVMRIERTVFAVPWSEEDFRSLLQNPKTINLAAVAGDELAGYSCTWCVLDNAELGNIAVDPACQNRGVGKYLLEATMRACTRQGIDTLYLEVRQSNLRAIGLYESYGFERIGLRRGYYRLPVEDAVIMKREL